MKKHIRTDCPTHGEVVALATFEDLEGSTPAARPLLLECPECEADRRRAEGPHPGWTVMS